jgi:GDP-mannose transporter
MIYTSTKALQFLSVPVYTIFKNLTIIVIAYGEVLWFGGNVTASALFSFGLMVLSSVVAAWADIQHALYGNSNSESIEAAMAISTLNAGYAWMGMNVFCTAAYVLSMRKVIKKMNFKDWDSELFVLYFCVSGLTRRSYVLQQSFDHSSAFRLLVHLRKLDP